MKNKILIILSIAFSLLLSSCEDFLNNTPEHDWAIEQAMTTYDKAQQAVNGIYGRFMPGDNVNQGYYVHLTSRSGFVQLTDDNNKGFTHTQSNSPSDVWVTSYIAINASNLAINGIPKVPDSAFPNSTIKNELIGEARFLRGYFHSLILLNYCYWWDTDESKFGIIYRDQTTDVSNVNLPRISVGESWGKIFEDIDFAIANMSNTFSTPRRVSKVFAKAYKAKLLLIRGTMRNNNADITASKALVDEVISTLPPSIKMESNMAEHFNKAWDSSENIFVRYLEDVANRTNNAGYWSRYGFSYNGSTKVIAPSGAEVSQSEAMCGLLYGSDWIRNDPRWFIATGKARSAETWDDTYAWVWKKIYREGGYVGANSNPKNEKFAVYHMRVPELYLMQSELIARTGGSNAQAIAPINVMRSKRTNPILPQVVAPTNKDELMDIIFKEYINELIIENGTEFYTSLRFQKNGKTYLEEIKGSDFVFDKTKLQWPIPNSEMINNNLLEQNPGQK